MRYAAAAVAILCAAALPALAAEATFERNLQVNGRVELSVATGSGTIHLTHGSGNQVHVFGRVKSGWSANEQRVHEIAANPPIEQTGNIVRIGAHHENLHNIIIDYEIQAPADAFLDASSGSGDVNDEGVGENAKLHSGSGSIHANGLHGGLDASTGSGDIVVELTGSGDVKADTGSGSINLKGVHGALRAQTGSGDIKLAGSPEGEWHVQTGSGSVEMWPGDAGMVLDASTGSGTVHTDREMTMQGSFDRHHVTGKIKGGGPTVRIHTGSGDINVH